MVVTEMRITNVESLGVNEASLPQPSPIDGNDTGTNFNGKDLSHHSIRGERSSKDLAAQQAKKPVGHRVQSLRQELRRPRGPRRPGPIDP